MIEHWTFDIYDAKSGQLIAEDMCHAEIRKLIPGVHIPGKFMGGMLARKKFRAVVNHDISHNEFIARTLRCAGIEVPACAVPHLYLLRETHGIWTAETLIYFCRLRERYANN